MVKLLLLGPLRWPGVAIETPTPISPISRSQYLLTVIYTQDIKHHSLRLGGAPTQDATRSPFMFKQRLKVSLMRYLFFTF